MSWVQLTGRGRKYLDSILPDLFRRITELMAGLDDRERKTLLHLLEKVSDRTHVFTEETRKAA
jgi:DNA-binding MarR family transcriptional regulator